MMEWFLAWIREMYWDRLRFWKDSLTVREPNELFVTINNGHVSLTQLNPIDTIFLEIASKGWLLRPSATMVSKCDTQFTHASFTGCPASLTIHRELVCSVRAVTVLLREMTLEKIRKIATRGRKEKCSAMFWFCVQAWAWRESESVTLYRKWVFPELYN